MATHRVSLIVDIFLFIVCICQIIANFVVLYVHALTKKLRKNDNLILLVSLAFIDFVYAVLQFPYLIILIAGWVPDGEEYNYNEYVIVWVGGPSAALMKSGCTVTTAIAIDRLLALHFPFIYYNMGKRIWSIGAFLFAIFLASIDWLVLILIVPIEPHSECSVFGCFTTEQFRQYWGISNMLMNLLSSLLTLVIIFHLCKRRHHINPGVAALEKENRTKIDKSANRVAIYILVVSAAIGVVPGCLNGFGMFVKWEILNEISYFVGTCATLSGLSHAFIFAMAHRDIRFEIGRRFVDCCFPSLHERMRNEGGSLAPTTTVSQIISHQTKSLPAVNSEGSLSLTPSNHHRPCFSRSNMSVHS